MSEKSEATGSEGVGTRPKSKKEALFGVDEGSIMSQLQLPGNEELLAKYRKNEREDGQYRESMESWAKGGFISGGLEHSDMASLREREGD